MIPIPEKTIYRVGITKILLGALLLVGFTVLFTFMAYFVAISITSGTYVALVLFIPGLLIVSAGGYLYAAQISGVVTIHSDRIEYRDLFRKHALEFSEIGGYKSFISRSRYNRGTIIRIIPADQAMKAIELSPYIKDIQLILDWLGDNFKNLEILEQAEETKTILDDPRFGDSRAEREARLKSAKVTAIVVNSIGLILGAGLMFVSSLPVEFSLVAIMFVPVTYAIVLYFRGIMYFNNKTGSIHPFVGLGIFTCGIGLLARGFFAYELVSFNGVWLPALGLAIVMWLILLLCTSEFSKRTGMDIANIFSFLLFLYLYSFGTVVLTNCYFDQSIPEKLETSVIKKSAGKNEFTIEFESLERLNSNYITVDEDLYHHVEVSDKVDIYIHAGLWGIPWYYLKKQNLSNNP